MTAKKPSFTQYILAKASTHKTGLISVILLGIAIELIALFQEKLLRSTCYLLVILLSVMIIERITFGQKFKPKWVIKDIRSETITILICVAVSFILMFLRFVVIEEIKQIQLLIKLALFLLVLLFIYPVFLLFYFLKLKRYRLREIGFNNFKSIWLTIPVTLIIASITFLIMPDQIQFASIIEEQGIYSVITLGFLTAAIPEEITRLLLQTRLAKVMTNKSLAWFMASSIWALGHVFIFYKQSETLSSALIGVLAILPIGLFWGYLIGRLKSIYPSIILHGTNLWGIQNIF